MSIISLSISNKAFGEKWRINLLCLFLLLRCCSSSSWGVLEVRERERLTLFYALVFSNAVFFRILIHVRRRIVGGSSTNSVEKWSANSLSLYIYIYIYTSGCPWPKATVKSPVGARDLRPPPPPVPPPRPPPVLPAN